MLYDPHYQTARAAEERCLSMASESLEARAIHLEMAARYYELAEGNTDRSHPSAPDLQEKTA